MTNEEKLSIHDNFLVGYVVDAKKCEILLKTEYRDVGFEETEVLFSGVKAYRFMNDVFETILFDIEESDLKYIIDNNWALFEEGMKTDNWPGRWATSKENAMTYLIQSSTKAFEISSVVGMSGWVLAESMTIGPKS